MSDITATPEVETPPESAPTSIGDLEPKMKLQGVVKRLELYGAFIDVGIGVDGLIHISKAAVIYRSFIHNNRYVIQKYSNNDKYNNNAGN